MERGTTRPRASIVQALKRFPQTRWFGLLWMAALLAMAAGAARAG